jgi:hypothetical protein
MSVLGLERGIKGSRATHTQIQKYYTNVTQSLDLHLDEIGVQHVLTDRKRLLKQIKEYERTVKALSKQLEVKDRHNFALETGVEALEQQLQYWQQKYQNLINTERISLQAIAYELGLIPIEGKPDQWRHHQHILKITDTSFATLPPSSPKKGSSEIDLVMLVLDCTFEEAVIWLNECFGEAAMCQSVDSHAREIVKTAHEAKFSPPLANKDQWLQVHKYLTEELKISSQLVSNLHHEGLIYADTKQNLIALSRPITDTAITGKQFTTSPVSGSKRLGGYFYFETDSDTNNQTSTKNNSKANHLPARVVLVDTPLEALTKATLDNSSQRTMYIALNQTQPPYEFLRSMPKDSVFIALNKNSRSEKLAHQIRQQLPKQTVFNRPSSIDWQTELAKAQQQKQKTQLGLELGQNQTKGLCR